MLIMITSACYGTLTAGKEVTAQVETMLASGKTNIEINNTTMGGVMV